MALIETTASYRGTCTNQRCFDATGERTTYAMGDTIWVLPEGIDESGRWPTMLFCDDCGRRMIGGNRLLRGDTLRPIRLDDYIAS